MGDIAEELAGEYGISRGEQDEFALQSQQRASAACEAFTREIVPVGEVEADEHPRPNTTLEKLQSLAPAFDKEGTITAGNASGINDGAATVLLTNDTALAGHGLESRARIIGATALGCDPARFGLGPVGAVQLLCEQAGWDLAGVDAVEINEAFAVQTLACARVLGLSDAQLNPRGGAIALGHPIGASGARILVTLLHHLEDTNTKRGIATLCVGGGMGIAMAIERG
jgi:acetyl-CoA acetyltransferase family protein